MFTASTLDRISPEQLSEGLNKLSISANAQDAALLAARYDADNDGKLTFWEFANIFLPLDERARSVLENRTAPRAQPLTDDAKHLVKRILARALNGEAMVEEIRRGIASKSFSLRGLFDRLDWLQRGYLTGSEFRRYFDNYPHETETYQRGELTPYECLEGLVRRFNKDKLNGRVSLPEFMDELTPKAYSQGR